MRSTFFAGVLVGAILLVSVAPAQAIPAFARKYGTSCQTCHVIYPKLTPFGEAFRRNGFKFPGRDEDFIKQEMVPLGQDAYRSVFPNAVWPGVLASSPPLAIGFNGFATLHPDKSSGAAQADNGARFSLHSLIEEAHLWAGGSFSEHIAYFGELTFADGAVEIEHAELHFNDLVQSRHLLNVYVGRGAPTLTSFGPHSSTIGDAIMPGLSVTGLYGATSDSFNVMGQYNLVEVNGMAGGRFIYAIGATAGANVDVRTTENFHGHVGYKFGGMRLDGENDTGGDASKPWAETALTIDLFGYHSVSQYTNGALMMDLGDRTNVFGGNVRGTVGSFEINSGVYQEWHNHATADGSGVKALAQYDELSYVVFPWLVPAVRLEWASLRPDAGSRISDLKVAVGAAALVRPNLKLTLVGQIEHADGVPEGGWGAAGGSAAPAMGSVTELEAIQLGVAFAF
jgi:hypothetical protein